nr:hypothetical protein [Tanacetum cinerariifolium]
AAISFPPEAEVERLLAMPTPLPSPLVSLSPPSVGKRLARCTAPTALPSPPLPPPLHMPPPFDRKDDIPETEMPPHKRLCLSTLGSRNTWIDPAQTIPGIVPMTVGEVNTRVTELAELHEHHTQDLYALLEDAHDSRTRISQQVDVDSQWDEHILLAVEQLLPPVISPTAESPGCVTESDPEEDPEEYEDDETEDGPIDYPMDGGDDGDDDDEYSVAVAVSGVSGAETRAHTPAPGESEAQNKLPDSILLSDPKPLVQHMPHPPQSVWSPGRLSYPP